MHLKRCQTVKLYIAGPLTFLYSHGAVWVFKQLIGYNIIAFCHEKRVADVIKGEGRRRQAGPTGQRHKGAGPPWTGTTEAVHRRSTGTDGPDRRKADRTATRRRGWGTGTE
uniref:Uncharacterized protein n=1 Tax=Oryza sativa subsp. japonica TaxID=39947 RepID=Q69IX9_ORYSJ|nr:hypothetical protein [Oryza sativa Japonica Group]